MPDQSYNGVGPRSRQDQKNDDGRGALLGSKKLPKVRCLECLEDVPQKHGIEESRHTTHGMGVTQGMDGVSIEGFLSSTEVRVYEDKRAMSDAKEAEAKAALDCALSHTLPSGGQDRLGTTSLGWRVGGGRGSEQQSRNLRTGVWQCWRGREMRLTLTRAQARGWAGVQEVQECRRETGNDASIR